MKWGCFGLLFITNSLLAQVDKPFHVQKLGGFAFSKTEQLDGLGTHTKKVWTIGLSHEIKQVGARPLTTEIWGNYAQYSSTGGFQVQGIWLGVQKNWYPLHVTKGVDFFHISGGVAYYGDTHNRRGSAHLLGVTLGIGLQYLIRDRWWIYTDWDLMFSKDLVHPGFVIEPTLPIVGVGIKI